MTILYVEDDETVRESFTEILEEYFSTVIVAGDGRKALELYHQHKPDVALLDISIPYISGLHVASKIREVDETIQIIILSAYSDQEKLLKAVNLQLFAYLIKPVQHKKFDKTMKNLLKKFDEDNIILLKNNFKWHKNKKELFYKDTKIKITNNEKLIVTILADNPNQYFSTYALANEISETSYESDTITNNTIQLLSRFKKKVFAQIGNKDFFIENSYGIGYKILFL